VIGGTVRYAVLLGHLQRADALPAALISFLPPPRYIHSAGTASLAVNLARKYGYENLPGINAAGWLHDAARILDPGEARVAANEGGWPPDENETAAGEMSHGPAGGALVAALGWGEDLAAAVRYHVTGRPAAPLADKILMAADAAEPSRVYDGVEVVREALEASLDLAVVLWIKLKLEYVRRAGEAEHPRAVKTLAGFPPALLVEAETRLRLRR